MLLLLLLTLLNESNWRLTFNVLLEMPDKPAAAAFVRQCCDEVDAAKIPAFMKFANTVRAHWSGIVHFVQSQITNGILEVNSKIQLAKR
jgi:transposase